MLGIVDYGAGNLCNVQKALDYLGVPSLISGDREALSSCDRLLLPGVGAFPKAMEMLAAKGLDQFLKESAKAKPLLGICLGMQLLLEESEEFTLTKGLGLIPGRVVRLPDIPGQKVPHMGWNQLHLKTASPLMEGIQEGDYVYFVHSYYAQVESPQHLAAVTDYGIDVTAVIQNGRVFGTQFHPEKSDRVGLKILENFCRL